MKGSVHEEMCLPCLTEMSNGKERLAAELLVDTRIACKRGREREREVINKHYKIQVVGSVPMTCNLLSLIQNTPPPTITITITITVTNMPKSCQFILH